MDKNWLIRTKNNHILGPVSREKIKELIGNGTIKGDDEICSGNGYWIYIREQELLSKYIMGDSTQGFNPVQEAEPSKEVPPAEPSTLPGESDLEYPELAVSKVEQPSESDLPSLSLGDITEGEALDESDTSSEECLISNEEVEEEPSEENQESNVVPIKKNSKETTLVKAGSPRKSKVQNGKDGNRPKKSSKLSINILYILAILFLLIAAISFKFKKTILNEINKRVSISIFPEAVAQANLAVNKKKNG